jgi:hypothetical protein
MSLEQIGNGSTGNGVALLVGAGIVYEVVAANCSSPQTAELNADKRAATLMKWVNLGMAQSAFFVGAAAIYDKQHAKAILSGGALAGVFMYGFYLHAKSAGLQSNEPPTENWGPT